MKKKLTNIIILIWLGQFFPDGIMGQPPGIPGMTESVILFTDRSVYIAGENICFSGTVIHANQDRDTSFSKVLYIEMISHAGNPVIAQKFRITRSNCTSLIRIPENVSTGIYYIKAYTRYMRNAGPGSFSYSQVKILNPLESEAPGGGQAASTRETGDFSVSGFDDHKLFEIAPGRTGYKQRDSINVTIKAKIPADSIRSACISVVPAHSGINQRIMINKRNDKQTTFIYKPEYKGITLSGSVMDKSSGSPLPLKQVDLSLIGEYSDFISVLTDPDGRFFISLPDITGQQEIFIGTENTDSLVPLIQVDNDFSPYSITIPYQSFTLSEDEQAAALSLLRNFRISSVYTTGTPPLAGQAAGKYDMPFYGAPVRTLNLDDYVVLPVLEDYFNELSYLVKVRKDNGKKYLKIQGSNPEINIYRPLVMMDMVAIYEPGRLLSLPPVSISHIDIINEPYVKGSLIYGGIVSVFSKNNDFAGIDLPPSGLFIRYDFLSDPIPASSDSPVSENIPDARNTLFWDGNLQLQDESANTVNFMTGNSRGEYDIILSGILYDGTAFSQTVSFLVE